MSSPSSRMESRGDKSRRSTLKTTTVVNKLQVLTEENEFHKIREKERSLHLVQSKKLLAQRNRNIERKRLSSAYAQTKPIVTSVGSVEPQQPNLTSSITLSTVIPASFKSNESDPAVVMSTAASVIQELIQENLPGEDNFDRFHYLHSTGSEISIARANNVTTSNGGFVNRKLTDEAKHVANFFTPSLVEICAGVIADNFVSQPTFGTIPDKLKNVVTKKLSVNLPLQISVPLVEDEDYWKKCCYMRWSDGQLGTFVKKQGENLFQHRKPPSIEEIMLNGSFEKKEIIQQNQKYQPVNQIDGKHKLWKQLYLERNLQEFLENIQSERSTSRELHVLAQQPDPKPEGNRGSELQILRSFDDLRRKNEVKMTPEEYEKTRQELASFDGEKLSESTISKENDIREEIEYTCLHSNKMRPNLNYYLLHNKTQKLPDESFREKLKDLYDGSESRGASRILNLTSNDDIFTFYDNAIHRNTVHKSQKKEALGSKSVQYWLLSKMDDEKNPKVAAMLNFVKVENLKTLQELCILCKPYIKELEILSLRSHINLTVLISNLSNLEYLHLTYGVRNAGLTFEMNMLGIYNEDCEDLASSLANSAYTANLKVLKLPDNLINDEKLKLLLTGLVKNNAITDLDLSHNKITALGCRSLSAYIRNNKTLKSLNLCDNNIRAEGGKFLATAIRTNDGQLETLNLRLNRLGDHGISAISASLEHNTKLRKLNLSSNDFGEEGLQHVAFYILDTDCSVNELDLSGNMFNENCGKILIKSLSNMTKKMILDVRSSQIRREEEIRIDSLIRNRTINQDKV